MRIQVTVIQMSSTEMHEWLQFTGDIFCQREIQPLQSNAWKWFVDGAL